MPPYHIGIKMHDLQPVGYPIPFVMATLNLLEWKGCWWSMGWGHSYTGFVSWMKFLRYIHITFFPAKLVQFHVIFTVSFPVSVSVFSHNISVLIFRFCDFFRTGVLKFKTFAFHFRTFFAHYFSFFNICLFVCD